MERPYPEIAHPFADHPPQALLHLTGGLVGEGYRQDAPRRDAAIVDEMGNAMREHTRLAGARARKDQTRPLRREDGFALGLVEGFDEGTHGVGDTFGVGTLTARKDVSGMRITPLTIWTSYW